MSETISRSVTVTVRATVDRERWAQMYGEPVEDDFESYLRHALDQAAQRALPSVEEVSGQVSVTIANIRS